MITRSATSLAVVFLLTVATPARASVKEELARFDAAISAELAAQSSEAAEIFRQANEARARGEHQTARDLYAQVYAMVPGFVHALRRQAAEELELGRRDEAVTHTRQALAAAHTKENLVALAGILASSPNGGAPAAGEKEEALRVAEQAVELAPDDFYAHMVLAQAALANEDLDQLERSAVKVTSLAPEEPAGYFFAAVAHAGKGNLEAARTWLAQARDHGFPEESYQGMLKSLDAARPWYAGLLPVAAWVLGIWAGLLLLLFVVGTALSTAALRAARLLPEQPTGEAVGLAASLRRLYQGVLWFSSAYYWVSIPIVAALVVLGGGAAVYALISVGHIPVKLVVLIVIGVFLSLGAIAKSLFVRGSREDPGLRMTPDEEPRLGALLREVAAKVGTRPVDNVYLTPGTELAVMERGGLVRQLSGNTERCFILGVGVIEGMKITPFKAILAHEYGHFSNRDTAGGGFALAVRRSLDTMAVHLAQSGAARWYNPAWLFVIGFYRVFLRVSQGASRLQEVLADRWAAFCYGAKAFERGLRHVIERSIRFEVQASAVLNEVIDKKLALTNLYSYQPGNVPVADHEIAYAVEQALNAQPSPYDSHPAPLDRFRWVQAIGERAAASLDDEAEAWTLFRNREQTERRLTHEIRKNVHANTDITIPGAMPA